jgi:hypothetical protein
METITFSYAFDNDVGGEEETRSHTRSCITQDCITVGEAVNAFQKFLSGAYGYPIALEYDCFTDGSKKD